MVMVIIPIEPNCQLTYVKVPILYNLQWLTIRADWHDYGRGRSFTFAELAILWLAGTVMGEVGAHNRGHAPWTRGQDHWSDKKYCIV